MRHIPLFDLGVRHSYYSDGKSPDFSIVPTRETSGLLDNFRAMTKPMPDGLRVITTVTESGDAFIPLPDGVVLRFEMRLKNPEFALITDPRDMATSKSSLYTNVNLTGDGGAELELISRETRFKETLAVVEPSNSEHFVLSGAPVEGVSVSDFKLEPSVAVSSIVEYNAQDKLIAVDSRNASPGQDFTISYPVTTPVPHGVFAHIEIHTNTTLQHRNTPSTPPQEFLISFRAKQAKWAYYCVTDLDGAATAYHVVDTPPAGGEAPVIFSNSNRRDLVANPDPLDDIAGDLAQRYPALKRFRFLSDAPVACQQAARKHLTLRVNGNDLQRVLPNPSFRNFSIGHVSVDNAIQEQDWLFEIVKVQTHNGA